MCPCTRVAPHMSQKNQQFLFTQGFFFHSLTFPNWSFERLDSGKRKIWKKYLNIVLSMASRWRKSWGEVVMRVGSGKEKLDWKKKKKKFYFENWQVETKSIFSHFLKFLMKLQFCQKWNFPMRPLPLVTVKYISIGKHMYIKSGMKNKLMLELHAQGMGWVQWGAGIEKMLIIFANSSSMGQANLCWIISECKVTPKKSEKYPGKK